MTQALQNHPQWSLSRKIAVRFFFIFFILFILSNNNGSFPFWDEWIWRYPTLFLHLFIPWVGKHILHLAHDITVFANGSGDTTYDYVKVLCMLILSLATMLLWSVFDRKRAGYDKLYYWLTVIVRFYIALTLVHYGFAKIIKLQFPYPGYDRLMETFGDSSPMGLAWTFFGFSKGYNLFMGFAEVSATLLLFRRTMTFGAIITLMTTANIVAINYFYDVPVKIFSTALFIMTLYLLLNDSGRLIAFFFKGESVSLPVISPPEIKNKTLRAGKYAFKFLVIGYVLFSDIHSDLNYSKLYSENADKPPFHGSYKVESFVEKKDGITVKPAIDLSWKHLTVNRFGYGVISYVNNMVISYIMNTDSASQSLDLTYTGDTGMYYNLHYHVMDSVHFRLTGRAVQDSIFVNLLKSDENGFNLTNRGFHWVNEYPDNK